MKLNREKLMLYAVTDRSCLRGQSLVQAVEGALRGGAGLVQLREKALDDRELLEEADAVRTLCRKYGVPFVLNDRTELVLAADADGVHVGQSDMDCARARAVLGPDKLVGVSCRTVEQALAAQVAGADYLGVGAVFSTGTKPDAKPVTKETLKAICAAVEIPVVAIGGISEENVEQLSGSGIAGVAVVSALFARNDTEAAARGLREKLKTVVG